MEKKQEQPSVRAEPKEIGWEMKGGLWAVLRMCIFFLCGALPVIYVFSGAVRHGKISSHVFWLAPVVGVVTMALSCWEDK